MSERHGATWERKCQCEICTVWNPLHERIMAKLDAADRELFDRWRYREAMQADELGACRAKLNGDWPGWEWMKKAMKQHAGWAGKLGLRPRRRAKPLGLRQEGKP